MNSFNLAMMLKPLGFLLIFGSWHLLILGIERIRPHVPRHPILDALFKERGG